MNTQKHIHNGLALMSFGMTGLFGFSLGHGVTALLFAVSMVLIQAAALLYMPARFMQAKEEDSGLEMLLYGGVVVAALLLSITASVATLSGSYDQTANSLKERATLQNAVDGYIEAGYITKALSVRQQLEALPDLEVTPLASAANRIEAVTGVQGTVLVTSFITLLALLLDLSVILLNSHIVTVKGGSVTEASNKRYSVTAAEEQVTEEQVTPANTTNTVTPEVRAVVEALNDGLISKPSVREIRQLLRCSQNHAAQIARNCRQLELSI